MKLTGVREAIEAEGSDLSGSSFRDVNLSGSRLHDANASGVVFSQVNLSGVAITDANLAGTTIDGVLVAELFAAYRARG